MGNFKMQVKHAAYWRGQPHVWSTSWSFVGSIATGDIAAAIGHMFTLENNVNYAQSATVSGGVASIALYNTDTGGVPLADVVYFPAETPGSWIKYNSSGWPTTSRPARTGLEDALQIEWQAGLGRTGKPIYFRKWFHAMPVNLTDPPNPDVTSAEQTSLAALCQAQLNAISGLGLNQGAGTRLAATTPQVRPFVGNHQMPRGRKRVSKSSTNANLPAIFKILEDEGYSVTKN